MFTKFSITQPAFAESNDCADVVWRLAVDSGLPSATAHDVCFVTLQNAAPAFGRRPLPAGPGGVMRAALEQRAVARCLAATRTGRPKHMHSVTAPIRLEGAVAIEGQS